MGAHSLLFRVREPDAKNPDGGYIPVSNAAGLPVHSVTAMRLAREGSMAGDYDFIPPNQTRVLGGYLSSVLVIPRGAAPETLTIEDGDISIPLFDGGSWSDRRPFRIVIEAYSRNGPWKLTTGNHMAVLATGSFDD